MNSMLALLGGALITKAYGELILILIEFPSVMWDLGIKLFPTDKGATFKANVSKQENLSTKQTDQIAWFIYSHRQYLKKTLPLTRQVLDPVAQRAIRLFVELNIKAQCAIFSRRLCNYCWYFVECAWEEGEADKVETARQKNYKNYEVNFHCWAQLIFY